MKHPSSRAYFIYWDMMRGGAAAPERAVLQPEPVRHLLDDSFVLATERTGNFRVRSAGTRLCALFGEVKDFPFAGMFAAQSGGEVNELLTIASGETIPAVAGLRASMADRTPVALELLLLPVYSGVGSTSLCGLIAPFGTVTGPLSDLTLTTWRHIQVDTTPRGPRTLRTWRAMTGMTVYEGAS